jgi:hypothetical protein
VLGGKHYWKKPYGSYIDMQEHVIKLNLKETRQKGVNFSHVLEDRLQ